jgi:hypothetical protein
LLGPGRWARRKCGAQNDRQSQQREEGFILHRDGGVELPNDQSEGSA